MAIDPKCPDSQSSAPPSGLGSAQRLQPFAITQWGCSPPLCPTLQCPAGELCCGWPPLPGISCTSFRNAAGETWGEELRTTPPFPDRPHSCPLPSSRIMGGTPALCASALVGSAQLRGGESPATWGLLNPRFSDGSERQTPRGTAWG